MSAMQEIGVRDRMNTAIGASLTVAKVGPVWRVKYRDERGFADVKALQVEAAVLQVARELGLA